MALDNKIKAKPAFPGRASSLGYEKGLTKLEWITTILASGANFPLDINIEDYIKKAKLILEKCSEEESK